MGVVVITASARVAFVASTRVLRLCVLWERLRSLQGPKLQVVQRLLLFRFVAPFVPPFVVIKEPEV